MKGIIDRAAAAWLSRYQAGEHEAVWAEMVSLGLEIRSAPYLEPAWSVAQETMRRARYNVETIVKRLDQIGYVFWNGTHGPIAAQPMRLSMGGKLVAVSSAQSLYETAMAGNSSSLSPAFRQQMELLHEKAKAIRTRTDAIRDVKAPPLSPAGNHLEDEIVFSPPSPGTNALIRKLEKAGMILPLSLKAWAEMVGDINLSGAHPALCFWRGESFPDILADPLMISLDDLIYRGEEWLDSRRDGDAISGIDVMLGYDADTKADLTVVDEQIDNGYDLRLPAECADAALKNEPHQTHFVDYLRIAFRWGGFPGWENQQRRPEKELRFLNDGLLPI